MANLYKNHLFKKAVEEARMKLIEYAPPPPKLLKWNWVIPKGKIIYVDDDNSMTMHPFDFVEAYSGFAKDLKQIDQSLEMLRKFMYEYINQKCPKL